MGKGSLQDRIFTNVITLILIILGFIALVPLLYEIAISFSSKAAADLQIVNLLPVEFTLDSWKYILTKGNIWSSFIITVTSTAIGVVLALLISALMAYPLSKSKFGPAKYLMLFVVFTMIFKAPTVPYYLTLRDLGLVNNYMVLILPHILTAYNVIVTRTFFKQFPEEVEEAAMIDGCGKFRTLFQIVLPSSKAVLATVGLFYGVTMWNQHQHPLMFITDTKLFPLQMKIRQLISGGGDMQGIAAVQHVNYSEATLSAAAIVFTIIPILVIYPFIQKYFAKGAMLGSVKG